ncbi:hypothetical protein C8Q74DRAFT_289204 [Fomes fomentarius]|nr:hypothetical protein C8Q74DRAFT_289204 [Fomes fomentarius]
MSQTESEFLQRPLKDIATEILCPIQERVETLPLADGLDPRQGHTAIRSADIAQLLFQRPNPDWMYLPHEILLSIFRLTQPHIHQYNTSVILGPRNPWLIQLRTKKALVLVCKAWSAPATVVLYDNIVLRRMGQISALANTLLKHSKLAVLVRSLCLESCVILQHCADAAREDLGSGVGWCSG